jgi:hypothetical protein
MSENDNQDQPVQPVRRVVWIKCRAHMNSDACPGNQAEVVFERATNPLTSDGGFEPNAGGRAVRYKCTTCKRTFHINS